MSLKRALGQDGLTLPLRLGDWPVAGSQPWLRSLEMIKARATPEQCTEHVYGQDSHPPPHPPTLGEVGQTYALE